jgi:hypothetical protein
LRVEWTKCPRKGHYSARKLIDKYGRKANMKKWKEQLNGDCYALIVGSCVHHSAFRLFLCH